MTNGQKIVAVIYILKRSLRKVVLNKTPYQAWHGRKPLVDFLNFFRYIAHLLTPLQHKDKFDEKGEKYIFLGHNDESKGYCP